LARSQCVQARRAKVAAFCCSRLRGLAFAQAVRPVRKRIQRRSAEQLRQRTRQALESLRQAFDGNVHAVGHVARRSTLAPRHRRGRGPRGLRPRDVSISVSTDRRADLLAPEQEARWASGDLC